VCTDCDDYEACRNFGGHTQTHTYLHAYSIYVYKYDITYNILYIMYCIMQESEYKINILMKLNTGLER